MSKLFKKSEEPIQPIEKELMLDADEVEKWGPSQEGRADYKPSLDDIEKELLEEARMNPVRDTIAREHAADPDRREQLKEEGRLGLQPDKKFINETRKAGIDVEKEFETSGQVHMPVAGQTYQVKPKQRHEPPL